MTRSNTHPTNSDATRDLVVDARRPATQGTRMARRSRLGFAARHVAVLAAVPLVAILISGCGSSHAQASTSLVSSTTTPGAAPTVVSSRTTPGAALTVVSSIKDGALLSTALPWTAEVNSKTDVVKAVNFAIDGQARWVERNAPYSFNDDGEVLVPALLPSGAHTLTVTAQMASGAHSTDVAHVTIEATPSLPASVVGDFRRTVTQADIDRAVGKPPLGVWTLHIHANGMVAFDDPQGSGGGEAVTRDPSGAVTMWGPPNWLLPTNRQGGFCTEEPPDRYQWSTTATTLTIRGGAKCPDREAIMDGTWQRI